MDMEDLVPMQDISGKLNEELCEMLADENWKIRKEGLNKLKELVSSAKFTTADLASLPAVLAPRTTDSNKNLVVQVTLSTHSTHSTHSSHSSHSTLSIITSFIS